MCHKLSNRTSYECQTASSGASSDLHLLEARFCRRISSTDGASDSERQCTNPVRSAPPRVDTNRLPKCSQSHTGRMWSSTYLPRAVQVEPEGRAVHPDSPSGAHRCDRAHSRPPGSDVSVAVSSRAGMYRPGESVQRCSEPRAGRLSGCSSGLRAKRSRGSPAHKHKLRYSGIPPPHIWSATCGATRPARQKRAMKRAGSHNWKPTRPRPWYRLVSSQQKSHLAMKSAISLTRGRLRLFSARRSPCAPVLSFGLPRRNEDARDAMFGTGRMQEPTDSLRVLAQLAAEQ